jgi:hypothetical protein
MLSSPTSQLGGLSILSFRIWGPLAFSVLSEAAETLLEPLLGQDIGVANHPDLSQREGCGKLPSDKGVFMEILDPLWPMQR